jgi:colanic acid biosynthesis glycosyl transferase WcaI
VPGEPFVRLLFINQHYPPDAGATGRLLAQLAEELVRRGHEVAVLTGRPTYAEARGAAAPAEETRGGVRVRRLPIQPRFANPVGRVLHYLSFGTSLLIGGARVPRPDVILALSSTPFFGGVAALALARLKRCRFVYCVQDLYPEIAVALGVLRSSLLAEVAARLERVAWRGAEQVVVIGRDLLPAAQRRGVSPERITVIPNWADLERILPVDRNASRRELGVSETGFLVLYAGNFGHSQDLETVLAAARLVASRAAGNVRFLLVGGGIRAAEVQRAAAAVPHVDFLPHQPDEKLARVLGTADLSLVSLRKGLTHTCVPSKIYSILASGRPVGAVLDADSEIARIVAEGDCGFRVDPGDAEGLAREILRLAADGAEAGRLGRNAREYGERTTGLARAADQYERLFAAVVGGSGLSRR